MHYNSGKPEFYICGGSYGNGVVLYASDNVTHIELEMQADELDVDLNYLTYSLPPRRTCTLQAESTNVVKIIADDYLSAF